MASHPDRVRSAPLPEGYQFGDARPFGQRVILLEADEFIIGQLPIGTTVHRKPAVEGAQS